MLVNTILSVLLGVIHPSSDPTDALRALHSLCSHTASLQVWLTDPSPFSREDGLSCLPCFQGLFSLAYSPAAAQNPPTCWWESHCSPKHRGAEVPAVALCCHQLIVSFLTDNFFREWLTLVQKPPSVGTLGAAARQRGCSLTPARTLAAPTPCHTEEVLCVVPTATQVSQAACLSYQEMVDIIKRWREMDRG